MSARYDAHAFNYEAELYWNVQHRTGKFPELEQLAEAGMREELAREIGRRCFSGMTLEEVLQIN